jgi:hypothetical protein
MFKANAQLGLFSFTTELSKKQCELLKKSKEKWFYNLIFKNINENEFKPLYSEIASRPNTAVNILVSALILKEIRVLSYDELMESMMFDMRYKTALGLDFIDEEPFSRATLFNFQNRILEHELQTGINLIERIFDNLTAQQIKQLKLKADIQRTDSTMISSNIRRLSRVQLLIEVLIRLERILDESDKERIGEQLQVYQKTGSEKYVYAIKPGELPRELEELGKVYHTVYSEISSKNNYQQKKEFVNFERAYKEHFIVVNEQVSPKPTEELNSGMMQSPDDQEATYRKKKDQQSKGFTINGTETANPENPVQLLTDIAVNSNNVDDSVILNNRIDVIKEKTPELNQIHTDGGYGSEDNDKKLEELHVTQVTTAVRGRESEVEKIIEQTDESPEKFAVKCPHQTVESTPTKKRHRARFDLNICKQCPLKEKCQIFKNKGRHYFTHEDYLQNKRNRNILNIPKAHQKLRPNVEATMKEYKTRTNGGKIKVRGLFKTRLFAFNVGIAINFGRIYRYIADNELFNAVSSALNFYFNKIMTKLAEIISLTRKFEINPARTKKNFEYQTHKEMYF